MKGSKPLLEYEDRWVTEMGAWFPGERVVYRGKDLFHELKDQRWMALFLYGITGRQFTEKQIRLFEGIWCLSTSYPEPRLWNNRVAALAGTARSTGALGVSAATAVSEATTYGQRPIIRAFDFLLRMQQELDSGASLVRLIEQELRRFRAIPGYGRPGVRTDERIEPLMSLARGLGFVHGRYLKLAFDIEDLLLRGRWRMHMNVAALAAALLADQGLTPREYYHYSILSFSAGIVLSFLDTSSKSEGCFFPLRCDRVQYCGKPRRIWN